MNVGRFITILELRMQTLFQGVKATIQTKNCHGKRQDNGGKDKILHRFLETRKSEVEF